jgi:hypothetical protein
MDRENVLARQFPLLEAAVPGDALAEGVSESVDVATVEPGAE